MPYHIVLKEASCVICRQSTEPYLAEEHQRVAAGMIPLLQVKCSFAGPSDTTNLLIVIKSTSSERLITTLPFKFPTRRRQYVEVDVFIHGREEIWRACHYPPCRICLASPEAYVFHMECFSIVRNHTIARNTQLDDTLTSIWLAGYWSRPWPKIYYETRPPDISSAALLSTLTCSDHKFALLLGKIQQLPLELLRMIVAYSADSPIWTYSLALAWPRERLGNLRSSEAITLSSSQLCGWRRGKSIPTCLYPIDCNKPVRLALDRRGIKSVDLLGAVVEDPPDTWYICEDLTRLEDFHIQSKVGVP